MDGAGQADQSCSGKINAELIMQNAELSVGAGFIVALAGTVMTMLELGETLSFVRPLSSTVSPNAKAPPDGGAQFSLGLRTISI